MEKREPLFTVCGNVNWCNHYGKLYWRFLKKKMKSKTIVLLCQSLSHIQLFSTPWTVACQAPLSMGFSRREYWSGLPLPPPWNLPHPEIEPQSPLLQADSLVLDPPGIPIWSSSSASGFLSKENRNASLKVYLTPMFITALFTIAKIWKQPVSIDDWMDKEDVVDR